MWMASRWFFLPSPGALPLWARSLGSPEAAGCQDVRVSARHPRIQGSTWKRAPEWGQSRAKSCWNDHFHILSFLTDMCLGKKILYISTHPICSYIHKHLSRCLNRRYVEATGKMLKRQWRASSKPKSSLISLHRSCNQQDFHVIWDLKKKATFPACYFFRDAEMVTWKASMITSLSRGQMLSLYCWDRIDLYHHDICWLNAPYLPVCILIFVGQNCQFLLEESRFCFKSPFWRLKPLFIWLNHQFLVNNTIFMMNLSEKNPFSHG